MRSCLYCFMGLGLSLTLVSPVFVRECVVTICTQAAMLHASSTMQVVTVLLALLKQQVHVSGPHNQLDTPSENSQNSILNMSVEICRPFSLGDSAPLYHRGMVDKSFTLRVISPADKPKVIEFLKMFFFRDEPLNIETEMDLDYINGKTCPELEAYCTDGIPEGNSVMAVSNTGELVGVCLNGRASREADDDKACPNDKFKKVLILLSEVGKQTDIFNRFPTLQKVMDVKIISVDSRWRGMGICKALLEKTREIAKKEGYQMVKVDCTSHISALAVSRLGFERIHTLKYADHFQDGKQVFNPQPPHWAVQVYIYKLVNI